MWRNLLTWLLALAWILAACGPASAPPGPADGSLRAPGQKLRVVATTNIIADMAGQVGGDAIQLTSLLPLGVDPHTYIATPRDVAAVAEADLILANGANLEADFLPQLIQASQARLVYVSEGIPPRELGPDETRAEGGEQPSQDAHSGIDPHTWTTPANASVFVGNIERALSELDPANADTYRANARAYQAELKALDEWVQAQINTIPLENRKLVTDHATFGYYADRYGLETVGTVVPGFSTASEPSAQELARLQDAIRGLGVRAIFVGSTVNPSLARQVAADTGIKLVPLYTGSLGPPGSGAETYLDYVRANTHAIVQGLR